jgi:hypothetical protein
MNKYLKFSISIFLFSIFLSLNSCSNEESESMEEVSDVLSETNLELLKTQALDNFRSYDFSKIAKPQTDDVNYEKIIELLSPYSDTDEIINFERVLGEYYDREYFQQMFAFHQYSKEIIQSNLFNNNSSLEEREIYLENILTYVILENIENSELYLRSSNCSGQYGICSRSAERSHGIRLIGCTAGSAVAAIFTLGAGAAAWPICMATSGFLWDSDMTACSESYDLCNQ